MIPQLVNIVSHGDEGLASHRMRCKLPMELINQYASDQYKVNISQSASMDYDINIFHKHMEPAKNYHEAIQLSDLSKIMFDICDDHFDRGHGEYYESMCSTAHTITCNTANMQKRIYEVTGRLAPICSDPITFPFHDHKYSENPDVVWYGHASNVFSILPYANKINNLTIITNNRLPHSEARTKFWKPDLVEDTISMYEIVVIPNISTPEAKNKSPNRAVDALHAGRFVIAEAEEVYGELLPFIFLGPIEEGIRFYKQNPEKVMDMIKKGQEYVIEKYNHKVICDQWLDALKYEDFTRYEK